MRVYHGGYEIINTIDFSKSKPNKDFGRGFYVTKFKEQAERWAKRIGLDHNTEGAVTEYEFDEFAWEDDELKTLRFDSYNEQWLDFIVLNRSGKQRQKHEYDIIEGPVADDAVVTRMADYIRGAISKSDFLKELSFFKQTHQICFCTLKSLQTIEKIEKYDFAYNLKNIAKQIILALVTENGLEKNIAADKFYDSKTFAQLADKSTKFYEKDWTEIYKLLLNEIKI